jgi:hypothetical protein
VVNRDVHLGARRLMGADTLMAVGMAVLGMLSASDLLPYGWLKSVESIWGRFGEDSECGGERRKFCHVTLTRDEISKRKWTGRSLPILMD